MIDPKRVWDSIAEQAEQLRVVAGCTDSQHSSEQTALNELIDRALLCRVHPQTIVNLLSDGETDRLQQLVEIRAH